MAQGLNTPFGGTCGNQNLPKPKPRVKGKEQQISFFYQYVARKTHLKGKTTKKPGEGETKLLSRL